MTYEDLLTDVQTTVNVLSHGITDPVEWDGAQTTKVRYAVKKTRDRLRDELDTYQEMVREAAEEEGVDPKEAFEIAEAELNGGVEEAPDAVVEEVQSILEQETGFEPHRISEEALMQEPNVPIPVIDLVDWMVD